MVYANCASIIHSIFIPSRRSRLLVEKIKYNWVGLVKEFEVFIYLFICLEDHLSFHDYMFRVLTLTREYLLLQFILLTIQ